MMKNLPMGIGDARSGPGVPEPTASPEDPAAPTPSLVPAPLETVSAEVDCCVLVIGADEVLPELELCLGTHRIQIQSSTREQALEMVVVAAPDLILLVGDAALDSGRQLLSELATSPVSSVIPVALLGGDEQAHDVRLRAFRYGAAAVIPRSAGSDAIAEHIVRLLRELPERNGDARGEIDPANLGEFVSTLSAELRSGILSIHGTDEDTPVRLVLGSGRPLAGFLDEFVSKVLEHAPDAESVRYEFDDRPGGTVQLLSSETRASEPPPSRIGGLRLLLADDDSARADVVAQALRARGANVAVSALVPTDVELQQLRQLDPEVVIVGEAELSGDAFQLLRRFKRDPRLCWASLLVVRWDEMRDPTLSVPTADRLTGPLAALAEIDKGLFDRAELGDPFDARLEVNGPARCLLALAASGRSLRVRIRNPRLNVELDLSDGLVMGARAMALDGTGYEGAAALKALLILNSGRVRVEPTAEPATTNLRIPIETALSLADSDISSTAPSELRPESSVPPTLDPPAPAAVRVSAQPAFALQRSSTRPKARRRVQKPLAAFLVGLGAIAGFGIAVILKAVTRADGPPSPASAASIPADFQEPETEPSLPSSDTAAAAAIPTPAAGARDDPGALPGPPPSGQATSPLDETGQRTPSCDALLAGVEQTARDPKAAAFEQLQRARKAMIQGKLDDAQRAYCLAARWDASKSLYCFELAQLLLIRRDGAGAAEWARKGVLLDPKSARGQSLLGDGLARIGDVEGARRAWFAAVAKDTPSPLEVEQLAQHNIHEAEQAVGTRDHVRVERFFRRAAILDTKNAAGPRGLSVALMKLGDSANALHWARRAVERSKEDAVTHLVLGDALLATGDRDGAREAWREAERLGYPDARRRILLLDDPARAEPPPQ